MKNSEVGRRMRVRLAVADALRDAENAALAAKLPDGFQWGADAMESFEFGKKRAAAAIHAINQNLR